MDQTLHLLFPTLEKLNTPEIEALHEAIFEFIFIFMSDVMSHLTNCSKTDLQSSTLPYIYPETTEWTLVTLKSIKDILKGDNQGSISSNKGLFPIFLHFNRNHYLRGSLKDVLY